MEAAPFTLLSRVEREGLRKKKQKTHQTKAQELDYKPTLAGKTRLDACTSEFEISIQGAKSRSKFAKQTVSVPRGVSLRASVPHLMRDVLHQSL
jgi:hypothetical protein